MKNEKVYLYWGIKWCHALYRLDLDDFRFVHCSDPIMAEDHSCLISEDHHTQCEGCHEESDGTDTVWPRHSQTVAW